MSKKEKRNSEINFKESFQESELSRIVDEFSASVDKMTQELDQKSDSPIDSTLDHSDKKKISEQLFQFLSVFPFLFNRAMKGVCKMGSLGYVLARNAVALPFRLVSFFMPHDEEEDDVINEEKEKENATKTPQPVKPVLNQSSNQPINQPTNQSVTKIAENPVDEEEEEEYLGFRWANLCFKIVTAAVIIVLITVGYFGVRSFLGKPKTVSVEEIESSAVQPTVPSHVPSNPSELPLPPLPDPVAKKIGSEIPSENKSPFAPHPAVTPEKESVTKKITEKPAEMPKEKTKEKLDIVAKKESVAPPVKEPEKSVPKPEKDTLVKPVNPKDSDKPKPVSETKKSSPPPPLSKETVQPKSSAPTRDPWLVAQSDSATSNHFSDPVIPPTFASPEQPLTLAAPEQPEKSAIASDPLTLQSTTPPVTTLAEIKQSTPTNNLVPLEILPQENSVAKMTASEIPVPKNSVSETLIPKTPVSEIPVSEIPISENSVSKSHDSVTTSQLLPLKTPPATTATVLPKTSNLSDHSQALTIPKSNDEVQTLPQLSSFSQPFSERSLEIPEQPQSKPVEFSKAPTPPEMTTPIPSLPVEPVIPVAITQKNEIVPEIPKSGNVQLLSDFAAPSPSTTEPSLGIPSDSVPSVQPSPALSLSQPVVTTTTTTTTTMPQPTPYVPPTFSQPTVSNPISQNNQSNQNNQVTSIAPNTMNTVPNSMLPETGVATKMNEPSLVIPKDSQRSELPSPIPVAASVPAILPQHEELAKVEPPLGSQLQNQVRGIRNQESSETKLRFGSGSNATTGAVRYHPKSTVQNNADLIPSQPMPVDTADPVTNPLLALLPTGNPQPGAADSLPPLETAPQPVLATPNPAYQRSLSNDRPLSVQSTSVQSDSLPTTVTNNERRASLFRRMDEEIKRSPTTAEQYTVQQNDTYLTISDRFFGTSRLFRALAEYNRQKYGTDYKLLEGTVIEIPPADYLKTNYAEVLSRGRQRFEKSTTPNISSPGLRYIVQEGDTVFRIATNQLRDSTRWQEIVNMNSDKLRDPRDLQPGMEIILPAATATQNTYGRR